MRLPALPRPGLDAAARARLDQAVLLAAAPASARDAVPDATLAAFLPAAAAPGAEAPDPWSTGPAALAATPPPAAPAHPLAPLRAALAEAEGLMQHRIAMGEAGWRGPAMALDQARVTAGRLALAAAPAPPAHAVRLPPRPAAPPDPPSAMLPAADAALARLQHRATGPDELAAALGAVREALGQGPGGATEAVLASLAGMPDGATDPPTAAPSHAAPGPQAARRPPAPPAIAPQGWGRRPGAMEQAAPVPDHLAARPAPYGPAVGGMLAGMAAALRLMRRQGLGDPASPGAMDRLAALVTEPPAADPPPDPADLERLVGWAGLARQAALLRERFGVWPWQAGAAATLAEGLQARAAWLAARPAWPGRPAAADALASWLPLVDCAEALGLPTRGDGACKALGATLRRLAATPLPALPDPLGLAQRMAALDAMACLRETLGLDPMAPEAGPALARLERGLAGLPPVPQADPQGALERGSLGRLRGLDAAQAGALGLEQLGTAEIPLLSRGLPVLAAREATARIRAGGSVP